MINIKQINNINKAFDSILDSNKLRKNFFDLEAAYYEIIKSCLKHEIFEIELKNKYETFYLLLKAKNKYLINLVTGPSNQFLYKFLSSNANQKISIYNFPNNKVHELKHLNYKNKLLFWNYYYSYDKLSTLSGRSNQKRRNLLNFFIKNNSSAEIIELTNLKQYLKYENNVLCFLKKNLTQTSLKKIDFETSKIIYNNIFDFAILEPKLYLLIIDKNIEGLSLLTENDRVLNVFFLNCTKKIKGAFQYLLTESIKKYSKNKKISWVFLYDDNGNENLRLAKLQYKPCKIIKNNIIEIN